MYIEMYLRSASDWQHQSDLMHLRSSVVMSSGIPASIIHVMQGVVNATLLCL